MAIYRATQNTLGFRAGTDYDIPDEDTYREAIAAGVLRRVGDEATQPQETPVAVEEEELEQESDDDDADDDPLEDDPEA